MKEHGHFEVIGETRDDAAGEAYDKVARTLTCLIQVVLILIALRMKENQHIDLPRAWLEDGSYDFSFSGLKSAVINTVHNAKQRGERNCTRRFSCKFPRKCNRCAINESVSCSRKNIR